MKTMNTLLDIHDFVKRDIEIKRWLLQKKAQLDNIDRVMTSRFNAKRVDLRHDNIQVEADVIIL